MVVGTMHGYHRMLKTYSFDTLYALVRAAKPDYVGVEIRPEDIGQDSAYLSQNYPQEMIHEAQAWGTHAFGFDWLGDELAGKFVPADWWSKTSWVKPLEQEMEADPTMQSPLLRKIGDVQRDVIKIATPAIMSGALYDDAVDLMHMQRSSLTKGTRYQRVTDFYDERDRHIGSNVVAFIQKHPGKRIVVLTGADHHGTLVRFIQEKLKSDIILLPVQ